ncbi:Alpha/Beta hydrolase protein [Aspergillus sergii]|uniref:Alpha/Beta hydrolase protein n=1 Tax=Aspergillus sergii TaxID=1034303 RepID=A0A5N6X3S1_9EURO|nr:Alpha/Beta hydrolase protein [Aspergillus sergii]
MPGRDIAFKTSDRVTLRGWFFTPSSFSGKLPCLVMAHGFAAQNETGRGNSWSISRRTRLSLFAYENRCIGASDGEPRRGIVPSLQLSDYADAITFAQTLPEVNPNNIAIWGSSYSEGHVLTVSAVDRRVKAVISQVPLISGWETFHRIHRSDFIPGLNKLFSEQSVSFYRQARAKGEEPGRLPVVDKDSRALSVLPSEGSFVGYSSGLPSGWRNDVILKRHSEHISPTPLLMVVADTDVVTTTDLAHNAFARAKEPKQLHLLTAGHSDRYDGHIYDKNVSIQIKFLEDRLLK